jgi:hypothetical protein
MWHSTCYSSRAKELEEQMLSINNYPNFAYWIPFKLKQYWEYMKTQDVRFMAVKLKSCRPPCNICGHLIIHVII